MTVVSASAPVRVCDIGGWTDTWFAGHGAVLHLAATPRAWAEVVSRPGDGEVLLHVRDYDESYAVRPGRPLPGRHPLLEACLDEVGVPPAATLEVSVSCAAPAGSSVGTSAAVTVALLGALTHGRLPPREVARLAHRIETERLGLQSGVQDQLCAAFGGINFVTVTDYPQASVTPVSVSARTRAALDDRLLLVYLGRHHVSSTVHEAVIAELAGEGPMSPRLQVLRDLAHTARDQLTEGDLVGFGATMTACTTAQAALHPELVSAAARDAIAVARAHGALGWKVNGAGGEGGSLSVLCGPRTDRAALRRALGQADPLFRVIPSALSRPGLQVQSSSPLGSSR